MLVDYAWLPVLSENSNHAGIYAAITKEGLVRCIPEEVKY